MMEIVSFQYEHAEEARQIARNNYEEERKHNPVLPEIDILPDLKFFAEVGLGVAAIEDECMLGYLCAWPPIEDAFNTTGVKGTFVPIHAHGVRGDLPEKVREKLYSGMYQAAAEKWVREGILSHGISLYTHDAPALTSFFTNGFGMRCIDAIRPMEKLVSKEVVLPEGAKVSYRELPREEWIRLLPMHNALRAHLGYSPAFMRFPSITEEGMYQGAGEDIRYFAAEVKGQDIAYIKLGKAGETFVSEVSDIMNICGAYCLPEFRGTGIFHNLLAYLITILQNEGYRYLGVDMESINPNARSFWRKYFIEYTNSVVRRIDDKAIIQPEINKRKSWEEKEINLNYSITKTKIEEQKTLLLEYLDTLTCVVDDYWEEHVIKADFYTIVLDQKDIGCFSIHQKEKLTLFYIKPDYDKLAQPIFKQILEDYGVKTAYVTTGDQLFLSLCMDHHRKIELQAYFFDGTNRREVRPAEYPRSSFFKVEPSELEEVLEKTGDFFQPINKNQLESEEVLLYKLCEQGEILGYGIIVPNKLVTKYWACGMITLEEKRRNGAGRSIQLHLGDICRENGFIPVSGCWYYNHLSKKTIESAGRYTKTRLLNVIF